MALCGDDPNPTNTPPNALHRGEGWKAQTKPQDSRRRRAVAFRPPRSPRVPPDGSSSRARPLTAALSPSFLTVSGIGNFIAHDMDEANTVNSVLRYRILDQTPKLPQDGLFLIQTYSGLLQLARQALRKRDAPQYNLTVEAADKGE